MKILVAAALCSVFALAACDGENPFNETTETGGDTGSGGGTDGDNDDGSFTIGGGVPPGVDGPNGTPDERIVRFEERNQNGGGYAEDFNYDAETDTFTVKNLAFDGDDDNVGPYDRGVAVASLGPNDSYAVYDADVVVPDFLDGDPVNQIAPYRAIVGISSNTVNDAPRTSFAIVRTGGYRDYGFGGFVYQREGGVVMPNSGQALFTGDYAGVRVFDGRGGLEFTEANMEITIDFRDPLDGQGGVSGKIFERVAYDINGDPIVLGNNGGAGELPLPDIRFVLNGEIGNVNADGELQGEAFSTYGNPDGEIVDYETGTYYGILAGDTTDLSDGGELVGVIVIESQDPRFEGVTAQETGGFILVR